MSRRQQHASASAAAVKKEDQEEEEEKENEEETEKATNKEEDEDRDPLYPPLDYSKIFHRDVTDDDLELAALSAESDTFTETLRITSTVKTRRIEI